MFASRSLRGLCAFVVNKFAYMKKKILIALVVIILILISILYIKFLIATSHMKELEKDLEQRITEWENKEYKRPPLFGPAIAGNAAEFYQQAESQMTELIKDSEVWIQWGEYVDSFKPLSTTGISYYEKAKPIIELVKQNNKMESYKSPLNIRDGFGCKIPDMVSTRHIAKAMVIQGRELEKNNKYLEALQLYCEIIRFGDSYFHYGALIPAMISIGVSEKGYEEIRRVLLTNKLSEQNINELISYLKILFNPEPSSQLNYETESLSMASILKSGIAKKESFPPSAWLKTILGVQAWDDIPLIYKEIGEITTLPYYKAKDDTEKLQERIKGFWNPITRLSCSITAQNLSRWHQHRATRRGLYILCALEIYKARHQKYPEKLSDLAPDVIKEVPLDPFSDQPFIYKVDQDQKIMLYSVSENLKDDGGDEKNFNDIVIAPLKKW